jgi:hypothetical protein
MKVCFHNLKLDLSSLALFSSTIVFYLSLLQWCQHNIGSICSPGAPLAGGEAATGGGSPAGVNADTRRVGNTGPPCCQCGGGRTGHCSETSRWQGGASV